MELPDAGAALDGLRVLDDGVPLLDSDYHHVHPAVTRPYAPPSTALLSFNQPSSERSGACSECQGLGEALGVVHDRLVVHPERSLHEGAFALWTEKGYKYVNIQHETIEGLRDVDGLDPDVAWRKLPESARRRILQGGVEVVDRDLSSGRKLGSPRPFPGFVPAILERYRRGTKTSARLAAFVREGPCPSCEGSRWSRQARALRVGGRSVAELLAEPFSELAKLCAPRGELRRAVPSSGRAHVGQLHHLASSFSAVGLAHLSGERGMLTLSEGESRRLRLAGLLHARGRDLVLLLDEPARGLHEQDVGALVGALRELKRRHTVILNDHRFSLAPAIDHVIELGPGAGDGGGRLVRQGPPGKVLARDAAPPERTLLKVANNRPALRVKGARLHNLRGVTCRIPLGRLVTIAGVSGSGKSSFVRGVLLPALAEALGDRVVLEGYPTLAGGRWKGFQGADAIHEVIAVEQRRPETNRRSLVATFLGVADTVRRAYGATEAARDIGLRAQDFGLNSGSETCLGLGESEDGAGFAPCPACGGRRFGERVLAVRLDGLNMVDLLDRSVAELSLRPPAWAKDLAGLFELLTDLDLGYLSLGRRLDRLSGGEVQRLRIAERLWRARGGSKGKARPRGLLLVLDEPSAGLHPRDVDRLLRVLDRIVGDGENTVLLVEHNLHLIRASDWVIEFGPGGGPEGGRVLTQGPAPELARLDTPTGRALAGRRPGKTPKVKSVADSHQGGEETSKNRARHARRWLKVLMGHEVRLASEVSSGHALEGLAVVLEDVETKLCRPHELGGLDQELARLFLLASDRCDPAAQRDALLEAWRREPEARVRIAPAVTSMQTWGLAVPASIRRQIADRLDQLHLEDQQDAGDVAAWRATGSRFVPEQDSEPARSVVLEDALAVGGGYVELVSPEGIELAGVALRLLDLKRGLVAPLRLTAFHLSRGHAAGCCPACRGEGRVPVPDVAFLVRDKRRSPTAETFLRPEALAILKGVRRSVMTPFFRRLEAEGIWNSKTPFYRLSDEACRILLFGYWCRPGPGSFLKSPRADARKVASWLRWDGLFTHVLEQLERSTDAAWVESLRQSLESRPCGLCDGSGLGPASRLVSRDGVTLHEWVTRGTVGELRKALRGSTCESKRERRLRDRVVRGLGGVAKRLPEAPLSESLEDVRLVRAGLRAVVPTFLQLPIID